MDGRYAEGLDHYQDALRLFQLCGEQLWQARALGAVGWCYTLLGEHVQALEICGEALSLNRELGDQLGEAAAWESLGDAHHELGHYREAVTSYQRSAVLYAVLGEQYYHAEAVVRGNAQRAAGNLRAARESWLRAMDMFNDQHHHPEVEDIRAKIASTAVSIAPQPISH